MNARTLTRFTEKVMVGDGCWEWTAHCNEDGYGTFYYAGQQIKAHRASYMMFRGPVGNLHVLHNCDNPCCVKPSHLRLGTNYDNMQDRNRRGRTARGLRNGKAKISDNEVRAIRSMASSGLLQREIGAMYGLTSQCVGRILKGVDRPYVR